MNNYVTKTQVIKGAWAVLMALMIVAGWSLKVFADHSTSLVNLKTSLDTEIEYRKAHASSIKDNTAAINKISLQNARLEKDNEYIMRMIEMLLEKERIPLPARSDSPLSR